MNAWSWETSMIVPCSYMDGDCHHLVAATETYVKKYLTFDGDTSVLAVCA